MVGELFIRAGAQRCIGKTFGRLEVVGVGLSKGKGINLGNYLECLCSCGNTVSYGANSLESGDVVSCGCHKTEDDIKTVKDICSEEENTTLYTDLNNMYLAKRLCPVLAECSEHGMINTTIKKVIKSGKICTNCNKPKVYRKEALVVGSKYIKGEVTLEIVDTLRPPYVSVVDTEYRERGSFTVARSNLLSKHAVKSYVRPFNKKYPAYLGIGDYDTVNSYLAHSKWIGMFKRCYDEDQHNTEAYKDCIVAEEWHNFQVFAKWFHENYIDDGREYHLEKDILVKGNKVYSPTTCCFVPRDINILFTSRKNHRGGSLLGVYYKKKNNKYCAQCADGSGGAQVYLGLYETQEEAFEVYKEFKEGVIKKQAEKFKDLISKEVYNTLINYEVERGD